jgi:hypothetical protein
MNKENEKFIGENKFEICGCMHHKNRKVGLGYWALSCSTHSVKHIAR